MATLELEITAEASYVPYQEKSEKGGTKVVNSGSDSSSYYSSSDDEVDSQPSKESMRVGAVVGRRPKRLDPKLLKVIEGVSLAFAVAVVLVLFSLPIYFYEVEKAKNQVFVQTYSALVLVECCERARCFALLFHTCVQILYKR